MDEAKDKRTDGRKPLCFIKSRKWVMTDGRGRSDGPGEPGERALRSSDAPWRAGRAGRRHRANQPSRWLLRRAAYSGMTRRAPRPSARRPACPPASALASFVLPSLLPNFLPGLSALLLLASFSLGGGGGGGARVRGWHAVSFILGDLFWPTASRAYLPLARYPPPPDFVLSFFPIESPQACQPACVRAGAGQWQRYHVTSTPPPPHLKKANCIERHRCHRRPPSHRPFVPSKLLSVRLFQPRHFG